MGDLGDGRAAAVDGKAERTRGRDMAAGTQGEWGPDSARSEVLSERALFEGAGWHGGWLWGWG